MIFNFIDKYKFYNKSKHLNDENLEVVKGKIVQDLCNQMCEE